MPDGLSEKHILRIALWVYLQERKLLKFLALVLWFVVCVAAGIEPTWIRFGLASLFLAGYVATLLHAGKKE